MTYEKTVILDQLKEIMLREQNINKYLFENTDILDIQIEGMISLLDNLHEEKKKLLNHLQRIKTDVKKLELKLENDIAYIKGYDVENKNNKNDNNEWVKKAIMEDKFLYDCDEVCKCLGELNFKMPKSLHYKLIINAIQENMGVIEYIVKNLNRDIHKSNSDLPDLIEEYILRRLNSESEIKGQIGMSNEDVVRNLAIVSSEVLRAGINEFFDIESKKDARNVGNYLIEFINEVYGTFYNDFKNPIESKNNNFKVYQMTFIGYLCIAKELYEDDDWLKKLEEILNKIDFSKNNKELESLVDIRIVLSKRDMEEIADYFTTFCKSDI